MRIATIHEVFANRRGYLDTVRPDALRAFRAYFGHLFRARYRLFRLTIIVHLHGDSVSDRSRQRISNVPGAVRYLILHALGLR